MVVRTLAFVIVRRVLGLVGLGSAPDAKDIEIAVLRHQLMVLRWQVARSRYTPDRLVLAMLARLLPRQRRSAFLVAPSTLLRWHRELVARRWTYPVTGLRSRGLDPHIVELVLRMARENRRWGFLRIVGEYGLPGAFVEVGADQRWMGVGASPHPLAWVVPAVPVLVAEGDVIHVDQNLVSACPAEHRSRWSRDHGRRH